MSAKPVDPTLRVRAPASAWADLLKPLNSHADTPYDAVCIHSSGEGWPALTVYDGTSLFTRHLRGASGTVEGPEYLSVGELYDTARSLASDNLPMTLEVGPRRDAGPEDTEHTARVGSRGQFEASWEPGHSTEFLDAVSTPGEEPVMEWVGEALRDNLRLVGYATDEEALKPVMAGVYFDLPDGTIVATDGHQLARVGFDGSEPWTGIVPGEAASRIGQSVPDGEVGVRLGEDTLSVEWEGGSIRTPLVEGEYVDYRQPVPTDSDVSVVVSREELQQALVRADLYAPPESHRVKLTVDVAAGELRIKSEYAGAELECTERLEIRGVQGTLEGQALLCNAQLMLEEVRSFASSRVRLHLLDGKTQPLRLEPVHREETGGEAEAVLMPLNPNGYAS